LESSGQPITDAASRLVAVATQLQTATQALGSTAEEMRAVVHEVNWLALVADGLRHPEPAHVGPTPSDPRPVPRVPDSVPGGEGAFDATP
jgi:hypothetical protein